MLKDESSIEKSLHRVGGREGMLRSRQWRHRVEIHLCSKAMTTCFVNVEGR